VPAQPPAKQKAGQLKTETIDVERKRGMDSHLNENNWTPVK
jgi:hypothetical protein